MRLALLAMLPLLHSATASAGVQRGGAAPAAPTTATVTVTDLSGAPIADVHVNLIGALDRSGSTQTNGTVRFDGLRPGTYRLKFTKEGFVQFEREIEVRAGQPAPTPSVALSPAPPPPPPPVIVPPPPIEVPAPLPPPGKPLTLSVLEFAERNFIGSSQPQKISPIGCSGLVSTVLWQVREPWTDRVHEKSDAMLYVVGGDGTLRLDGRDVTVQAGGFASVPRGTTYSLTRRGRNPLIVLATLAGEPCTP